MAFLTKVPLERETVSNYYFSTADFIELTSGGICGFFITLQEMKEELLRLTSRQYSKMSKIQSHFRMMGADYIEWLDSQLSHLEILFKLISMRLELANGGNIFSARPQLPASKKGKIFARWLRDNPGIAETLGKENDQNKHNSEASGVQNEAKRQLPDDEVSSPKGGQVPRSPSIDSLLAAFLYTREVDGKMLPQEVDGGAEQVQFRGAKFVDLEGHYRVRFAKDLADLKGKNKRDSEASEFENETKTQLPDGAVKLPKSDDDPLPPATASMMSLFGDTGEDDGEVLPQETDGGTELAKVIDTDQVDHEGRQRVTGGCEEEKMQPPLSEGNQADGEYQSEAKVGDKDISNSSGQKLREGRAVTTAGNHSCSHGGSDRNSNQNVKASGSRKDEDEKKSPSNAESHHIITTAESQPIDSASREVKVLYMVWAMAHQLLRLYHDHMRRAALVLFHLWENGIWLDDSAILKQMLAHLQRTCDFMEKELIEANRLLVQVADDAMTVDLAGSRTMGRTAMPVIPTELLRPVARPQVPTEEHFGQRIWRLCRYFFSRHPSNHR